MEERDRLLRKAASAVSTHKRIALKAADLVATRKPLDPELDVCIERMLESFTVAEQAWNEYQRNINQHHW